MSIVQRVRAVVLLVWLCYADFVYWSKSLVCCTASFLSYSMNERRCLARVTCYHSTGNMVSHTTCRIACETQKVSRRGVTGDISGRCCWRRSGLLEGLTAGACYCKYSFCLRVFYAQTSPPTPRMASMLSLRQLYGMN